MLLRVGVAGIGPGDVGHGGGVELLAEFPAQLGDAAFGILGQLQRLRPVLDCVEGLAGAEFEVAQQALQLLLQLAHLLVLLFASFGGELIAFAGDGLFAGAQFGAFDIELAQFGVQAVKKARNILPLR